MRKNTPPQTNPDHPDNRRSDEEVRLRLLEGMLRDEERAMSPGDIQLLDEIELCASTKRSDGTRREYRQMQEHFLAFLNGHGKDLATAKKKHVEFFVAHLKGGENPVVKRLVETCSFCQAHGAKPDGYSPSYIKRHLAAIKAAYDYLIDEDIVPADPTSRVLRPTVYVTRQYRPTREEVRKLMGYHGTPRSFLAVRWGYYVPARRSELVSPRWNDIDEFNRWHLTAKGGKSHSYKLHAEVVRALRIYGGYQEREARRHPAMARALADPETAGSL
jgi:integrase